MCLQCTGWMQQRSREQRFCLLAQRLGAAGVSYNLPDNFYVYQDTTR